MKYYKAYKEWLENEYSQWERALALCTIDNFKKHPAIIRMLGDIDPAKYEGLVDVPPLVYYIDGIGRDPGPITGAGLRMLYYAEKVLKRNPSSIIEIGGGVGQFYATLRAIGYKGKYMIVDRQDVVEFQHRYLLEVERRTGLDLSLSILPSYEFCVSFYALGEFDDETKAYYVRTVVNRCAHGFVVWNPHSGASKEIPFHFPVTALPEFPQNHPDCLQLEW